VTGQLGETVKFTCKILHGLGSMYVSWTKFTETSSDPVALSYNNQVIPFSLSSIHTYPVTCRRSTSFFYILLCCFVYIIHHTFQNYLYLLMSNSFTYLHTLIPLDVFCTTSLQCTFISICQTCTGSK